MFGSDSFYFKPTMQLFILIAVFSLVQAAPRRTTDEKEGNTFTYKYSTNVEFKDYPGADAIPEYLTECRIQVTYLSPVLRMLKIPECHMSNAEDGLEAHEYSTQLEQDMSQYHTIFQQSPTHENMLLSHPAEQPYALNLKRAIVDLFLSTTAGVGTHKQSGLRGECEISVSSSGNKVLSTKLDLSSCSGVVQRIGAFSIQDSSKTSTNQAFFNVSGSEACDHERCSDGDVLCAANCFETIRVRAETLSNPFTVITRKSLELLEVSDTVVETGSQEHLILTDLSYDKYPLAAHEIGPLSVHEILEDLFQTMQSDDPSNAPTQFSTLRKSMANLNQEELHAFAESVLRCEKQMTSCSEVKEGLFWDALFHCGTNNCLQVAVDWMKRQQVSSELRMGLYMTLINSVKPDRDTLRIIQGLCEQDENMACVLPLSIIARKYSNEMETIHPGQLDTTVEKIIEDLIAVISPECEPNVSIGSARILHVLKALANIGGNHLALFDKLHNGIVGKTITSCVGNIGMVHPDTASIGLQAIAGYPLTPTIESKMTDYLMNFTYPVEFRAAVFKFLVRYGSERVLQHVIRGAKTIEVQQLRSYVYSHLQNIIDGSHLVSESQRNIISAIIRDNAVELPEERRTAHPKSHEWFTGNIISSPDIKTDVNFEAIYRPAGFLPTASNVKVSMESMDNQMDLVEIDVHQHGFDALFSGTTRSTYTESADSESPIEQRLRELYHVISTANANKQATLHFKLFDFHVGQLVIDAGATTVDVVRSISTLLQTFVKGVDMTSSSTTELSLVSSIIVTSGGTPLNLTTDSSLLLSGAISGSVDQQQQKFDKSNLIDDFYFSGRFNFRLVGQITSKAKLGLAGCFQAGVESTDRWLTDIDTHFRLSSSHSELVLTLDTLSPESVITNTRYTRYADVDGKLTDLQSRRKSRCLWSSVETFLGWSLCGQTLENSPLVRYILKLGSLLQRQFKRIVGLAGDMINYDGQTLTLRYRPHHVSPRTKRSEPDSWAAYVQSALGRLERTIFSPPTTYTAMVMGDSHITTFDGRTYTLPAYRTERCIYLLVRDTLEHQFSVLQSRNGVEIITKSISVTIDKDGRVRINRASSFSDLPVMSGTGDVTVLRLVNDVEVRTTFGFHLKYNINGKFYTVGISGRYHNKTIGLLGTSDNEPSNDFLTRSREVTQNKNIFIESHEISARQECHPGSSHRDVRRRAAGCQNEGLLNLCDRIFGQQLSTLSTCFEEVNPSEFLLMCKHEATKCNTDIQTKRQAICELTAAYINYCKTREVILSPPSTCKMCGQHNQQSTWQQSTEAKVDVVIITPLRNRPNQANDPSHYIKALLQQITSGLKRSNPKYDLRIGLVGYGGDGAYAKPHIYTANGKLFQSIHQLADVQLQSSELPGPLNDDGGRALELAIDYPYRPTAVKMVFLISNTDPQILLGSQSIQDKMLDAGITLNVIGDYDILASEKIVGLTSGGEFITTSTNTHELEADFPQTAYAQLSKETHGLLLDKTAISASQIAGTAIRHQVQNSFRSCNRCTCAVNDENLGVIRCKKVQCQSESLLITQQ